MKLAKPSEKDADNQDASNYMLQPWIHRLAYHWAAGGWRGSQFVWKFALNLKKTPDASLVKLPNGFVTLTSKSDWNRISIYKGQYDRPLLHLLSLTAPEGLVIDVGANIGFTLWAACKRATDSAYFLALEPSPSCFEELKTFATRYGLTGKVLHVAAGKETGILSMYGTTVETNSGGASLLSHADVKGDEILVKVQSLDDIIEEENLVGRRISLLKIDTEGYEGFVLAGARNLLHTNPPDVLVAEVSPMFGDISYLKELWEILSSNFEFFEIEEIGRIKRNAHLTPIELQTALLLDRQINLVAIKRDLLHNFL